MNDSFSGISLGLIAPLIILQFVLFLVAIIDLIRIPNTNGPKWMWAIIICLAGFIGPVVYFIVGRRQS